MPDDAGERHGASIEAFLLHDRWIVLFALLSLSGLAWLYLIIMASRMAAGDMSMMGLGDLSGLADMQAMGAMDMSQMPWTVATVVLMFVMWSVMMVGMMVPSATPMILLFARVQRHKFADAAPGLRISAFVVGYLLVWVSFSLIATGLQWLLTELRFLSPMMESTNSLLASGILLGAGAYQLSPLKQACLRRCQSPADFLASHWQDGVNGSLRMGFEHGVFCLGCCWLLMTLLFVGGVMNLIWVAAIAFFVLLEKIAPRGEVVGKIGGGLLACFAVYIILQQ